MTTADWDALAEQVEREERARKADERALSYQQSAVREQQEKAKRERDYLLALGRPEYQSLKNAKVKDAQYHRHLDWVAYEKRWIEARRKEREHEYARSE